MGGWGSQDHRWKYEGEGTITTVLEIKELSKVRKEQNHERSAASMKHEATLEEKKERERERQGMNGKSQRERERGNVTEAQRIKG